MDDVEVVGLIKLNILAQGGLAVLRDTQAKAGYTLHVLRMGKARSLSTAQKDGVGVAQPLLPILLP